MFKTKDLQDPSNLKYLSIHGSIPKETELKPVIRDSSRSLHLIDNIEIQQLTRLWPDFVSTKPSNRDRVKFPLPWHPMIGYC